jgi:shikimate dehydrogenase
MPRLAVLGHPVSHSRSPAMQTAALAELGLAPDWTYEAIDVRPADFGDLVASLPGNGFAGVNVTVPHKLAALARADEASAAARAIGAANTLSFGAEGRTVAANTDAVGITAAIGAPVEGRRALVLGAGGSARAAIWGLREAGAGVSLWNRTHATGAAVAAELGATFVPDPRTEDFDLIVNATTVGLEQASGRSGTAAGLKALPVDADALHREQVVVDLVYGQHDTELASRARESGAHVIDGLEVLVHQGAASLRIWTGLEPPIETMRTAARGG